MLQPLIEALKLEKAWCMQRRVIYPDISHKSEHLMKKRKETKMTRQFLFACFDRIEARKQPERIWGRGTHGAHGVVVLSVVGLKTRTISWLPPKPTNCNVSSLSCFPTNLRPIRLSLSRLSTRTCAPLPSFLSLQFFALFPNGPSDCGDQLAGWYAKPNGFQASDSELGQSH